MIERIGERKARFLISGSELDHWDMGEMIVAEVSRDMMNEITRDNLSVTAVYQLPEQACKIVVASDFEETRYYLMRYKQGDSLALIEIE